MDLLWAACFIAAAAVGTPLLIRVRGKIDGEDQQQLAALRADLKRLEMAVASNPVDPALREALLKAQARLEDQQFYKRAQDGL